MLKDPRESLHTLAKEAHSSGKGAHIHTERNPTQVGKEPAGKN